MADNKYPYSSELKAPADNSKVDYDDPKTIAGMAKIGKMQWMKLKNSGNTVLQMMK